MTDYKKAKESDVWRGYPEDVMELGVPKWAMPRETLNGNWVSIQQVMEEHGVSRTTIYNWMAKGVKSKRFGGRRFLSARDIPQAAR